MKKTIGFLFAISLPQIALAQEAPPEGYLIIQVSEECKPCLQDPNDQSCNKKECSEVVSFKKQQDKIENASCSAPETVDTEVQSNQDYKQTIGVGTAASSMLGQAVNEYSLDLTVGKKKFKFNTMLSFARANQSGFSGSYGGFGLMGNPMGTPMGTPMGIPMGYPMGNGGTPMGNGGTPMGNGGTPMGNGGTPMGNGGTPMGNGGTPMGNGGNPMGTPMGTPMGNGNAGGTGNGQNGNGNAFGHGNGGYPGYGGITIPLYLDGKEVSQDELMRSNKTEQTRVRVAPGVSFTSKIGKPIPLKKVGGLQFSYVGSLNAGVEITNTKFQRVTYDFERNSQEFANAAQNNTTMTGVHYKTQQDNQTGVSPYLGVFNGVTAMLQNSRGQDCLGITAGLRTSTSQKTNVYGPAGTNTILEPHLKLTVPIRGKAQ